MTEFDGRQLETVESKSLHGNASTVLVVSLQVFRGIVASYMKNKIKINKNRWSFERRGGILASLLVPLLVPPANCLYLLKSVSS